MFGDIRRKATTKISIKVILKLCGEAGRTGAVPLVSTYEGC
jgi:hypothetical protein